VADRAGFENQCALRGTAGSNPALSVVFPGPGTSAWTSGTCSVFSILRGLIALELPSGGELFCPSTLLASGLGQIVAVIALATFHKREMTRMAVNVSNIVGLFSGANAFFPEAGEPEADGRAREGTTSAGGFTTALWRRSSEISPADCRDMLVAAGFSHLMDTCGRPKKPLCKNG
jgi:hypothetical protein